MEAPGIKLRPIRTKLYKTLNGSVNPINLDDAHHDSNPPTEPVTPAGRVFCSPSFNVHIMVILGSKIPIDMEAFKKGIHNTILKHKRFCSIIRTGDRGELYWEPTTVNLDDHIKVVGSNDVDAISPTFVEDYVAKLMQAPPLDMSMPLFEFHILKAKLGDAAENVVFRVHHALGDGTSLMSLLLACTRKVSEPDTLPTLPTQAQRRERSNTAIWKQVFLLIWRFFLILWYTLVDVCSFIATVLWLKDSQTIVSGYPGVEKSPRRLAHRTVSMDDIRHIKQAIHGTVNDVIFGMLVAGLTRYLQQRYYDDIGGSASLTTSSKLGGSKYILNDLKDNSESIKVKLPYLRVRACALINTRPSPGLHELENMLRGGSQARWGNNMGYVFLPVPLSAFEDPLEYAHKAKNILDKKKMSLGALFSYRSGTMLMNLTGPEMPIKLTYKCTLHTTLAFSNVFGPLEEIQFFGHPVTHIIPTVSGQPQALCVHVQSYMGKITIVVSSAKDVIPDPEKLCNYMVCALEDMAQSLPNGLANRAHQRF